jgi:hypothetical protein
VGLAPLRSEGLLLAAAAMACCSADGPASVPRPKCGKVQRSDAVVQLWPLWSLPFPSRRHRPPVWVCPQCRWQTIIDTGASMLSLPAQFFDVLLAWIPDVECSYDEATYITRYALWHARKYPVGLTQGWLSRPPLARVCR